MVFDIIINTQPLKWFAAIKKLVLYKTNFSLFRRHADILNPE